MNKELESTAIHEAGHAIACLELEVLHGMVSIVPGEGRDGSASVEGDDGFYPLPGTDPFSEENERAFRAWAEKQAVIDYAGHAAVVMLLDIGDMSDESSEALGAGDDYEKARERLGGDSDRIKKAQAQAVAIVTNRRAEIEKVARELINRRRLSSQQIDWVLYRDEPIPEWLE